MGLIVEVIVMGFVGDRGGFLDLSMYRKFAFVFEDVFVGDDVSVYVVFVMDDGIKVIIVFGIIFFILKIEMLDKLFEFVMKLSFRFIVGERVFVIIVGVKVIKK